MPKILVIEDDKFLRELLERKLREEGFTVSSANNGEEGLNKIQEEKPELVLLDLILPGIDGFEILKKIRENPELSHIPIIVLSNLGQQEDIKRAKSLGAKDYLVKAYFTLGEIVDKIKSYL